MEALTLMGQSDASTLDKENDLFAIDLKSVARAHLVYILYERARANIEQQNIRCANLRKSLYSVLANFAVNQLKLDLCPLYESGFFTAGSAGLLELALKQTLIDLRQNMVGLAEVVPSMLVSSTIGNYYGDIYENQYETALNSPLNTGVVPDLIHSHIKPTMALNPVPKL